jgi:hypothetical protein
MCSCSITMVPTCCLHIALWRSWYSGLIHEATKLGVLCTEKNIVYPQGKWPRSRQKQARGRAVVFTCHGCSLAPS